MKIVSGLQVAGGITAYSSFCFVCILWRKSSGSPIYSDHSGKFDGTKRDVTALRCFRPQR